MHACMLLLMSCHLLTMNGIIVLQSARSLWMVLGAFNSSRTPSTWATSCRSVGGP